MQEGTLSHQPCLGMKYSWKKENCFAWFNVKTFSKEVHRPSPRNRKGLANKTYQNRGRRPSVRKKGLKRPYAEILFCGRHFLRFLSFCYISLETLLFYKCSSPYTKLIQVKFARTTRFPLKSRFQELYAHQGSTKRPRQIKNSVSPRKHVIFYWNLFDFFSIFSEHLKNYFCYYHTFVDHVTPLL